MFNVNQNTKPVNAEHARIEEREELARQVKASVEKWARKTPLKDRKRSDSNKIAAKALGGVIPNAEDWLTAIQTLYDTRILHVAIDASLEQWDSVKVYPTAMRFVPEKKNGHERQGFILWALVNGWLTPDGLRTRQVEIVAGHGPIDAAKAATVYFYADQREPEPTGIQTDRQNQEDLHSTQRTDGEEDNPGTDADNPSTANWGTDEEPGEMDADKALQELDRINAAWTQTYDELDNDPDAVAALTSLPATVRSLTGQAEAFLFHSDCEVANAANATRQDITADSIKLAEGLRYRVQVTEPASA